MKKLLFGFALVAMVLAVGCKNGDSWGDVDKKAKELKLTDGEWEYEYSYYEKEFASDYYGSLGNIDFSKIEGFIESESETTMTFTVSNNKVTVNSYKQSGSTTYPSGVDTAIIQAEVSAHNVYARDGEEFSSSGSTAKSKYEPPATSLPKDLPVDIFINSYLMNLYHPIHVGFDGVYTNEDGTKYRYYYKSTDGVLESESETTLVKQ